MDEQEFRNGPSNAISESEKIQLRRAYYRSLAQFAEVMQPNGKIVIARGLDDATESALTLVKQDTNPYRCPVFEVIGIGDDVPLNIRPGMHFMHLSAGASPVPGIVEEHGVVIALDYEDIACVWLPADAIGVLRGAK
jgi:hypothetical protein